uniref:Uncharacterized protein n=1 Tax=Triticum urartu TaxID=4572 RepID=A0A8R7UK26_TRIUA
MSTDVRRCPLCYPTDEVIQGAGGFVRLKHQHKKNQFWFSVVISPSSREHQPSKKCVLVPFFIQSVVRNERYNMSFLYKSMPFSSLIVYVFGS